MASSSAPPAGLAGRRYLATVALLALLSTVPTLLLVAVGTAVLTPSVTGSPPAAPYPFVTYAPGPALGGDSGPLSPQPLATPATDAPLTPAVDTSRPALTSRDVFVVGCGW